jgi:hypothetical protein
MIVNMDLECYLSESSSSEEDNYSSDDEKDIDFKTVCNPYYNKEVPDKYKSLFKETIITKKNYNLFIINCHYCNEYKCNPFSFTKFLDCYNLTKLDFITCNLCFNRHRYSLDKI